MFAALLTACTPDPDPATGPAQQSEPAWGSASRPLAAPLGSTAPTIAEVMASVCPEAEVTGPEAGGALHRLMLWDSPYRCNDGTPPALFVRAALDPAHASDWVIHLDGGASCDTHQRCVDRWCAVGNYDASDMSAGWSPLVAQAGGILGLNEQNSFRGWNIAELYYCTSDVWVGTRSETVLLPEPPDSAAQTADTGEVFRAPLFSARFEGDGTLSTMLGALSSGAVSDDGTQVLPPLVDASTVLFSGSSAGGYGAGLQLNPSLSRMPDAKVFAVIDSSLMPSREHLNIEDSKGLDGTLQENWGLRMGETWGAVIEAVCAASTPSEELWRCFDMDHLFATSLAGVPIAVHHDLYDTVPLPLFEAAGLDESEYIRSFADTLREYADRPNLWAHGTACGRHMALTIDDSFLVMRASDAVKGGPALSMHDIVRAMVDGEKISAVDVAEGTGSLCP